MFYLLSLLILSTLGGQIFRIPYLQGTGVVLSDFILLVIGIFWLLKLLTKQSKIHFNKANILLVSFLIFTFISLLLNIATIPSSDALISFFYFVRFGAYLALFFIIQDLREYQSKIFSLTALTAFILVILGFLQLNFFPDFEVLRMQEKGWDPHIGRMLSTWFDPNFLGGFFVFVLSLIGGVLVLNFNKSKNCLIFLKTRRNFLLILAFLVILVGLVLTYSRSSYLAFLVAMFFLSLIASRKLLLIGVISVILIFGASERIQKRVIDAYQSAQSIFNPYSVDTLDATARYRMQSWQEGMELFKEKPVVGQGFNTLRYLQSKKGFTGWKAHNAGGIDASLLTLLVTTGFIGITLFFAFIFQLLKNSYLNYKNSSEVFFQGINLGYFCGIIGLLIHSLFVNSLLFPFIMIFVWMFGGMISRKERV